MDVTNNSRESQRARLLDYLHRNSCTTLEAREKLNICHPAARVQELRDAGHDILTFREQDINAQGHRHIVAKYVLMKSAELEL